MLSLQGFGAEDYRYQIKQKTREALRNKAKKGHGAGNKAYGYDHVRVGSDGKRAINEREAVVVRRIFDLCAQGLGMLKIARILEKEGMQSPRGVGWGSTSIREVLRRELYLGKVVYGRTKRVERGGKNGVKIRAADDEILTMEQPELRIVSDEQWEAEQTRLARIRQTHAGHREPNGELHGRPETGLVSKHLLAGFLRCGVCGASMFVAAREQGRTAESVLPLHCPPQDWLPRLHQQVGGPVPRHHPVGDRSVVRRPPEP